MKEMYEELKLEVHQFEEGDVVTYSGDEYDIPEGQDGNN